MVKRFFPDEIERIDLVVIGPAAVNNFGAKVGKGEWFSDLEYAIGLEFRINDEYTPIITTIHPFQLIDINIPMMVHDVPLSYIVTKDKLIKTENFYKRPNKVFWNLLDDKIKEIAILNKLMKNKKKLTRINEYLSLP